MLAYCGIDCGQCPAYKATVSGDRESLGKVAVEFGKGKQGPADWMCLGCGQQSRDLTAVYCSDCRIRGCAVSKGLANCVACGDYESCGLLQPFLRENGPDSALLRKMDWLRSLYLARRRQAASS